MKRLFIGLLCLTALHTNPVLADLEVPGESNPVLSSSTISLDNKNYSVVKRIDSGSVTLKVFNAGNELFWSSDALGEQEKLFVIDDNATPLAIKDVTGDNVPEIITAAMIGPDSSALYVFKYDPAAKKFAGMNFKYEKSDLSRDFMVSDLYQKDGQDIVFMPENTIRALGKIYSEENGPKPGFYYFKYADGLFNCSKTEAVPSDNHEKQTTDNHEKQTTDK